MSDETVSGWVLRSKDGSLLYRGNANREYRGMRIGSFYFETRGGAMPIFRRTKREAIEDARKWNSLDKVFLRNLDRDLKPMRAISPVAKVRPVKVRITLEEA